MTDVAHTPTDAVRGIEVLPLEDPRWASFAATHRDATAFHLPAWGRLVADCYRFRAFAVALTGSRGELLAGLPVVEVRRPLGRRRWVSLPFTDHCPPLLGAADIDGAAALVRTLESEAALRAVRRVQLRAELPGAAAQVEAVRHVMPVGGAMSDVAARMHRSQVHRNVRRAEREGVTVRVADDERDLTETFFRLHLMTRRRQGVPVQPRRFFALVWQRMIAPGHGHVLVAERDGVPLAAAVFLRHNATVIYKWGASDADAWKLRPNHALFWHAITAANAAGDSWFDWGRTDADNEGLRAFKSEWGGVETPLVYSTIGGAPASPSPESAAPPRDSLPMRIAADVIRRGPNWVATAAGEALYRYTA